MKKKFNEDWPEVDVAERSWNMEAPVCDLYYALDDFQPYTATFPSVKLDEKITLAEVDKVVRYHVAYHGEVWTPGEPAGGSELDMYVVGQLVDGRWFSVVGWNDYTGWGCQDGADIRIGVSELAVVHYGLDEAGRKKLGYEA